MAKLTLNRGVRVVRPEFAPPAQSPLAYKFPMTTPLHLTASATIGAGSSGGVNAIALKNPLGEAMEILEIKFLLTQSTNDVGNMGGVVACKLDLGNFPLTNGFVPVWLLGRCENLFAETVRDTSGLCANHFTWRLPHPLYVPPDGLVVPTFQHRGLVTQNINVRISYSARSIPRGSPSPKKVVLPYAAAYVSKGFNPNLSGTDNSLETDLINPFDQPIRLQRFTGRIIIINDTGTPPEVYEGGNVNGGGPETTPTIQYNVRMVDSFGRPIIRNFTPFGLAFSRVTRSWELDDAVMDPRSYYLAYIRKDVPFQTVSAQNMRSQAFVGLVGHRVVATEGA